MGRVPTLPAMICPVMTEMRALKATSAQKGCASVKLKRAITRFRIPARTTSSFAHMADLAVAIGYPVILTVGVRLGCINHTLVSVAAIEHSGLTLAGWVANEIDPNMPVIDENIATLETRLSAPLLGRIPWDDTASAAVVASCLSMEKL